MFILEPQFLWFFSRSSHSYKFCTLKREVISCSLVYCFPGGGGYILCLSLVIFRSEVYFFFISFAESASFFLPSQQLYCNSPALLMFFNLALYRCESLVIIQFKRAWLFPKYNKKPLQPLTYYYVLFRLLRFQ